MTDVFLPLSNYKMDSCPQKFFSLFLGKGEMRKENSDFCRRGIFPRNKLPLCCCCMSSSKTLLSFIENNACCLEIASTLLRDYV